MIRSGGVEREMRKDGRMTKLRIDEHRKMQEEERGDAQEAQGRRDEEVLCDETASPLLGDSLSWQTL
eukprot:767136-Hanusia_phi.AAC.1